MTVTVPDGPAALPAVLRDLAARPQLHLMAVEVRSFGTCSIAEPLADLRALGLLAS